MGETYNGGVPLVEAVRSGFVESVHRGSVVVLDADGAVLASAGDVRAPVFPRSSNKPMQAIGMIRSGLRLDDPADLAVVCASHYGEDHHLARIEALLRTTGLDESALRCPPDLPLSDDARDAVLRAGGSASRLRMNCSGKHVGMLLTCQAAGWPVAGYWQPDHPLQQRITATVEEFTGESAAAVGVDGCGAPVLAVSLTGLAGAYLRLVSAEEGSAARAVADAMRAHPLMVAGTDGDDTRLMTGIPGLLAKSGAEGVVAVALPGVGAVAIKIDDGAARARMPVLVSALRRLSVHGAALDAPVLDILAESVLSGGGEPVGSVRARW
ncbi:asparaginase [Plantactinospora sp. S1510]|uniref:Asparaginase n=1 Tax=Plantactinospora alkalitolerans TaxID=2789879 RepID=A0ABS0H0L5_9ACTN|nr:asparaginase [Plantactinospora alkalitolerans]MBF9131753.1 asparaginase [Plantactinospora alkalitolerans]